MEVSGVLVCFTSSAFSPGIDYGTAKESPNFKDLITTQPTVFNVVFGFNIRYKNITFRKQRKLFHPAPSTVTTSSPSLASFAASPVSSGSHLSLLPAVFVALQTCICSFLGVVFVTSHMLYLSILICCICHFSDVVFVTSHMLYLSLFICCICHFSYVVFVTRLDWY